MQPVHMNLQQLFGVSFKWALVTNVTLASIMYFHVFFQIPTFHSTNLTRIVVQIHMRHKAHPLARLVTNCTFSFVLSYVLKTECLGLFFSLDRMTCLTFFVYCFPCVSVSVFNFHTSEKMLTVNTACTGYCWTANLI